MGWRAVRGEIEQLKMRRPLYGGIKDYVLQPPVPSAARVGELA